MLTQIISPLNTATSKEKRCQIGVTSYINNVDNKKFILFLNNDTIHEHNWIELLVKLMSKDVILKLESISVCELKMCYQGTRQRVLNRIYKIQLKM